MFKRVLALLTLLMFMFACIPAIAAEEPVIYKSTITVTENGGRFQVGFVNIEFKKEFLDKSKLPATFEVEVSAVDGKAGIEFDPSTPDFYKAVHIRVDAYKGLLFDKSQEINKNIQVDINKQQIKAEHFSRYSFR